MSGAAPELILFSILGFGSLGVLHQYAYAREEAPANLKKLLTASLGYSIGTLGWPALRQTLSRQ